MRKTVPATCFYCGANVSGGGVGDHFPLPKSSGGGITVPCCQSCHDMKDRYSLNSWPIEWVAAAIKEFPLLSRETRLLIAKMIKILSDHTCISGDNK